MTPVVNANSISGDGHVISSSAPQSLPSSYHSHVPFEAVVLGTRRTLTGNLFTVDYGVLGDILGSVAGSVAAFFTMLFSYLYSWSVSTSSQATGHFNLSLHVDTLANPSRTSLARTALARPFMSFILISIFLPTVVEGHNDGNNTVTNVDVYNWVKGAPKSVRENFRITFLNEATFHRDLSQDFLFPRLKLPIPWPPPGPCPGTCPPDPLPDPFGVYGWLRGAPVAITGNFQIGIIIRDIFVDDPDGGAPEPPPPNDGGLPPGGAPNPPPPPPPPPPPNDDIIGLARNEILIQRLWATSFGPIGR